MYVQTWNASQLLTTSIKLNFPCISLQLYTVLFPLSSIHATNETILPLRSPRCLTYYKLLLITLRFTPSSSVQNEDIFPCHVSLFVLPAANQQANVTMLPHWIRSTVAFWCYVLLRSPKAFIMDCFHSHCSLPFPGLVKAWPLKHHPSIKPSLMSIDIHAKHQR